MSVVYADLVVPRLGLTDALERVPLATVRDRLTAVRAVAGLGRTWATAELVALDRGASAEQEPRSRYGVSWRLAPLAGVGFASEDYRESEPPVGAADSPAARARYGRRAPEIAAVRSAALVPAGPSAVELTAALDLRASLRYDLVQGYRRRLAHLLAYEASLRAGSLAPYDDRVALLGAVSPGELLAALPEPGEPSAFSVTLNVLAALREVASYQEGTGEPHPQLGRRLDGPGELGESLARRLSAATEARRGRLHADARIALTALTVELERVGVVSYTGGTIYPTWGLLADPDSYLPT